jgi:hypothetical protein
LLAYYDPQSSCWKTSQDTLLSDSTGCSLTLPAWGWMRNGELYEHPMSAPLTGGQGCSSLLPTPHVEMGHESGKSRDWGGDLTRAVLLPTPTGDDANNVTRESGEYQSLVRTVNLLPTPTTQDGENTAGPSQMRRNSVPLNGAFTPPPSTGGNTPSDEPHPHQLTIGDG